MVRDEGSKRFAYLVQGRADLVASFSVLHGDSSDLFFLTYDEALEIPSAGSIFDPNVSWAEGRNNLLGLARENDYEYFIFLDDDVQFTNGNYGEFERLLEAYSPYVGLPLVDEIERSGRWCPDLEIQLPIALDQVMQAFSREAVEDGVLVPYRTEFDKSSWWYSCEINQHQILSMFRRRTAQFNTVRVKNMNHHWNEGVTVSGSSYRGGVTPAGLEEVNLYLQDQPVLREPGPWDKLGNDRFVAQVQGNQVRAGVIESLKAARSWNFYKLFRKLRGVAAQLRAMLLYATVWRSRRVDLCVPYDRDFAQRPGV